jgi:hypothetical protein
MDDENSQKFPESFGFRSGPRGVHTSRTIMFAELNDLLAALPAKASKEEYRQAILTDNALGKKTLATRRGTAKRLGELYALDPRVPLFRLLRVFWNADQQGRRLLAFLCASARDPLLRLTAPPVLSAKQGETVAKESLEKAVEEAAPNRFKPGICQAIARRAASSWTQAGHLSGHVVKKRSHPVATPANTAYALVLGYLCGIRGQLLLTTYWAKLLDLPAKEIARWAAEASRRGWLNFRQAAGVIEVRFPDLLTAAEKEMVRGED